MNVSYHGLQLNTLANLCSTKISKWLEEVTSIIYFTDLHNIAVPPYINIQPILDMKLWGSDY